VHEHLTFVEHIYVDVNGDVITVRLSFVLQELVRAAKVGLSSYVTPLVMVLLIFL
jgi:hypothetical protein